MVRKLRNGPRMSRLRKKSTDFETRFGNFSDSLQIISRKKSGLRVTLDIPGINQIITKKIKKTSAELAVNPRISYHAGILIPKFKVTGLLWAFGKIYLKGLFF